MISMFSAYSTIGQQSSYLHNLSSVSTATTYGCHMDRWSLLTSPYDVTAGMANCLPGRLSSYMPAMSYSYPLSPGLGPTCTMTMSPCGQGLTDAAMLTGMPLRAMPNVNIGQSPGLSSAVTSQALEMASAAAASQAMASLDLQDPMAECKRLTSLSTLRLKAKDHTTVVQY